MNHTHKVCSKCRQIKPVSDFCLDRASKDGLQCQCKLCKAIWSKQYYQTDKGKLAHNRSRRQQKVNTNQYWIDADGYLVYGLREKDKWESVAEIPQHYVESLSKILRKNT